MALNPLYGVGQVALNTVGFNILSGILLRRSYWRAAWLQTRSKKNARPDSIWSGVVEMGGSRTPRPHKRKGRCTTGIAGVLVWRFGPPPTGFFSACPLVLDDA
jgi:hypothetical protein